VQQHQHYGGDGEPDAGSGHAGPMEFLKCDRMTGR